MRVDLEPFADKLPLGTDPGFYTGADRWPDHVPLNLSALLARCAARQLLIERIGPHLHGGWCPRCLLPSCCTTVVAIYPPLVAWDVFHCLSCGRAWLERASTPLDAID